MDGAAIEQLLASLTAGETGWEGRVPADAARFLGHSVGIDIQTRFVAEDGPLPMPDAQQLALARQILAALPQLLIVAEREYSSREGDHARRELVSNPHIWLCPDEFEEDGPGRWAFVVERNDWPDYGVHIEFDGLEFLECWGGD